jgi:hypothetical protein
VPPVRKARRLERQALAARRERRLEFRERRAGARRDDQFARLVAADAREPATSSGSPRGGSP